MELSVFLYVERAMASIISFDIDLGRIHAYSNTKGIICSNAIEIPHYELDKAEHEIVLIEVASANFYQGSPGQVFHRAKWAIFNSMMAGRIYQFISWKVNSKPQVLVAPSSKWTLGYEESVRDSIAGVTGDNHDIRQCRTMQFFYGTNPEKWAPFEAYFFGLSTKKGSDHATKPSASRRPGKS